MRRRRGRGVPRRPFAAPDAVTLVCATRRLSYGGWWPSDIRGLHERSGAGEAAQEARRALTPEGLYLVNLTDRPPLTVARTAASCKGRACAVVPLRG